MMQYDAKTVSEALRRFLSWVDTDGTKMAMINLIVHGEIEIGGIDEGGFIFTLSEEQKRSAG